MHRCPIEHSSSLDQAPGSDLFSATLMKEPQLEECRLSRGSCMLVDFVDYENEPTVRLVECHSASLTFCQPLTTIARKGSLEGFEELLSLIDGRSP